MAVRAHRKSKSARILLPATLNPTYRRVARSIAGLQEFTFEDLPYDTAGGNLSLESLRAYEGQDITALVIQQPNFFGVLEEVDELVDWAHRNGTLVIGVVNPTSLALLKPPGQWGQTGADIACGEGQPLGVPLSAGGPYFGFMATRLEFVRQMPGRIVGRTVDLDGRPRFHADAAGARTAHSARQGDLEHLHQPGPARNRRHDLSHAARSARPRACRSDQSRPHRRAGAGFGACSRRATQVCDGLAFTKRWSSSIVPPRRCSRHSPSARSWVVLISAPNIRSWSAACWYARPRRAPERTSRPSRVSSPT